MGEMALTVIAGAEEGFNLEREIKEVYLIMIGNKIDEFSEIKEALLKTRKTGYQFVSAEKMIEEFYLNDTEGEFVADEFQPVTIGLAMGVESYYQQRMKELKVNRRPAEELVVGTINDALVQLYTDPNDFITEYQEFKVWHEKAKEPVRAKVLTFWLDCVLEYSAASNYLERMVQARELLKKESKGMSFTGRKALKSVAEFLLE